MIEKETDLYLPVKKYLEDNGYTVRGEVKNCDIVAIRDNEVIALEMKKSFNLELVLQCVDRQRKVDTVYLVIPRPNDYNKRAKWNLNNHLIRRLELGMLFVAPSGHVDVVIQPATFDRDKSKKQNIKKRRALITEFQGRSFDGNIGGCTRKKLMTAYREKCIEIGTIMLKKKIVSPAMLVELGCDKKKTGSILLKNFYG